MKKITDCKIINWLKENKLSALLLLLLIVLLLPRFWQETIVGQRAEIGFRSSLEKSIPSLMVEESISSAPLMVPPDSGYPPTLDVEDRLVVQESNLSLMVKEVAEVQKEIIQKSESLGGYLVSSFLSHPEEKESASGTVTVRVPQEKFQEALNAFRGLAVKLVEERLSGQDVTDEYVDLEARLATLLQTKGKLEVIMAKAEKIPDILQIQRELTNLQRQIDSLKGRQQFLEKNAQLVRITVYLSADEISLPYSPSQSWRPKVIFKLAIRSLIAATRKLGTMLIWVVVYAIIWLPILILILLYRRRQKRV